MKKAKILEEQTGFTVDQSCLDHTDCFQKRISKQREKNKETHLVFVDLQKAYNMMLRKLLWPAIRKMEIHRKFQLLITK